MVGNIYTEFTEQLKLRFYLVFSQITTFHEYKFVEYFQATNCCQCFPFIHQHEGTFVIKIRLKRLIKDNMNYMLMIGRYLFDFSISS
jgi:hypothetical protein